MLTTQEMWSNDEALKKKYGQIICGVDESGRGSWAGPMVAAAVCFGPDTFIEGVRDSKRLSTSKRAYLYDYLTEFSLAWAVSIVLPIDMDAKGMTWANHQIMLESCEAVSKKIKEDYWVDVGLYLIDNAPALPELSPQIMVPKADDTYYCVAAASIIAKHTRDTIMAEIAEEHPNYGFEYNKGYVSPQHIKAVQEYGMIPDVHRFSFRVKGVNRC